MLSRGFTGTMPVTARASAGALQWAGAAAVVSLAAATAATGWMLR